MKERAIVIEEEPAGEPALQKSSDFSRALKEETWKSVKKTGNVSVTDVVGMGEKRREEFATAGLWSPSDFYGAYKSGHSTELAAIADKLRVNLDTVADLVLVAPEAPPGLSKQKVLSDLAGAFKKGARPFNEKRAREIERYLRKLNINGKVPVSITFQEKGAGATHEKAETVAPMTGGGTALPTVMFRNQIITGNRAIKREAMDSVFENAVRRAMIGVDRKNRSTAFNRFFDSLAKRNPKINADAWTNEADKKKAKAARKKVEQNFFDGSITIFEKEGILVHDPDISPVASENLRPSDEEMARYLFSKSKATARIGETNNFEIASLAKSKEEGSGSLVFPEMKGPGKEQIRLTGHMNIASPDDIQKLVAALGTNPKNGFLPIGYAHSDDIVKKIMYTFEVFANYPPVLSTHVPRVIDIVKDRDKYTIKFAGTSKAIDADASLWLAKEHVPEDEIEAVMKSVASKKAMETFGKPVEELTPAEMDSLEIDKKSLPEIWGLRHEYAGSTCTATIPEMYRRLRALESDMNFIGDIGYEAKYKAVVNGVEQKIADIKNDAKTTMGSILASIKNDAGTMNKSPKPYCAVIPKIEPTRMTIVAGPGTAFIEKKLDKAITKCGALKGKKRVRCFSSTVAVTQNAASEIESRVWSATARAREIAGLGKPVIDDTKHLLSSVERLFRTGYPREKRVDNKIEKIYPSEEERRDILNEAKLGGKIPLSFDKWAFLNEL